MVPVRKKSKARKRSRRAHHSLRPPHLVACPQCGRARLPHRACRNCGYVNAHTSVAREEQES